MTALPETRVTDVTAEWMQVWARILDDPNQIHLDGALVRSLGLGPDVINQGPLNIAYVLNAVTAALPGARLLGYSARMLGNVFAGDRLTVRGTLDAATGPDIDVTATLAAEGRGDVVGLHLRLTRAAA
ncbi:MaoC family dehydratase [Gemmobacter sp.]|uniref:MaoC family dehydratase n=1 Tax=Gemmobacter sp. TaxID=1898957 RepID=UPI002AFEEDB3|nr:MaoC family dehydratase [Gemmobacter sp.]